MKRFVVGLVTVIALLASTSPVGAEVTDGDISAARDRLISTQAAADSAAGNLVAARRAELAAGKRVSEVEVEIAGLKGRVAELTALLKAKAIHAYKNNGDLSSLTYVAGIVDLEEQDRRQMYLGAVIEQDNRNLAEMSSAREDLAAREVELSAEKQKFEEASAGAEIEKRKVDDALATIAAEKARLETEKASQDKARAAAAAKALEDARREASAATEKRASSAGAGSSSGGGGGRSSGGGGGVAYGGSSCPVAGGFTITSFWGDGRNHRGLDMAAPVGTPTVAITSGTIARSGSGGGYGNMVYLAGDDGNSYLYAHHRSNAVSTGQRVSAGQVIGYVGSTGQSSGNHLHFEVHPGGGGAVDAYPTVRGVC